jgi:hypothetical protein
MLAAQSRKHTKAPNAPESKQRLWQTRGQPYSSCIDEDDEPYGATPYGR